MINKNEEAKFMYGWAKALMITTALRLYALVLKIHSQLQ